MNIGPNVGSGTVTGTTTTFTAGQIQILKAQVSMNFEMLMNSLAQLRAILLPLSPPDASEELWSSMMDAFRRNVERCVHDINRQVQE